MRRHVAEPVEAGGFEGRVGGEARLRCGSAGRPRVTVREMSAVRFSFSRSINSRFFATNRSTRPVSRSRNAAMARCSANGWKWKVEVSDFSALTFWMVS